MKLDVIMFNVSVIIKKTRSFCINLNQELILRRTVELLYSRRHFSCLNPTQHFLPFSLKYIVLVKNRSVIKLI